MRRPVVLWLVVVLASLIALGNVLEALRALGAFGSRPLPEVMGDLIISIAVTAFSIWVIVSLLRKRFRSKTPVSLYLWVILIIYPVCNVLRALGLYLPGPDYAPEELAGAAVREALRYLLPIGLIVWVGFSKALRAHLQSAEPVPA